MTRATLLPSCIAAALASVLTLAGVLLVYPPLSRAEVGAQLPPSVVRAQRFEVIDSSGAIVATLSSESERSAGLAILDATGQQRAGLGIGSDGTAFVQAFTPQGAPLFGGALLQARPDGTVSIAAVDQIQARAQLALTEDASAALQLISRPGGTAVQLP